MSDPMCAKVRNYFQRIFVERRAVTPAPDIYIHIAACPLCRGALALQIASVVGQAQEPIRCQESANDIAAFIDVERAEGTEVARRYYPRLWWHLWGCEECADVYRMTRELLAAQSPMQSAPPGVALSYLAGYQPLFYFERAYLTGLLGNSYITRGGRKGSAGVPIVIADSEPGDDPQLTVRIQRQRDGSWAIDATVQPAPSGWLVATLGEFSARAHFDTDGSAQIRNVPEQLLLNDDGPDIDLSIEESAGAKP